MSEDTTSTGEYEEMWDRLHEMPGPDLPPTWTTRDGTVLAIADMADSHLLNAARLVLRAARRSPAMEALRLFGFLKCARVPLPNGEHARYAVEDAIDEEGEEVAVGNRDDVLLREVSLKYAALRAEIDRRALTFTTPQTTPTESSE